MNDYQPKIYTRWDGQHGSYVVNLDNEDIHFTKDSRDRDMFVAELKIRARYAQAEHLRKEAPDNDDVQGR